ncbi:Hypothetical predicted protein, partial [Cloeon dipterum]
MKRRGLLLLILVCATLFRLPKHDFLRRQQRQQDLRTLTNPYTIHFATVGVAQGVRLSCWVSVNWAYGRNGRCHFSNICRFFTTREKCSIRSAVAAVGSSLTIFALLCGDINVLPGPLAHCIYCNKVGRRNAVKISCSSCLHIFHRTCLAKHAKMNDKDLNSYRKKNNFQCWSCTLPNLNDSYWSLPPPPPNFPRTQIFPRRADKNAISFLTFNARSLKDRNKAADIIALLDTHAPDICAVNETWLAPDVHNHEVLPREYVVLRKDRLGGRRPAGGVLLAIRPFLQPKRLEQLEGCAEVVWAQIRVNELKLLVGSGYRRPNADDDYNKALMHSLDLAAAVKDNFDGSFLMGDFNLDVCWESTPPLVRAPVAENFVDAFASMGFSQLINSPTRTTATTSKTLDLFLSDVPAIVATTEVVPGVSDHDAVKALLALATIRPLSAPREIYDFRKANWPAMNDALLQRLQAVLAIDDVTESWENWKRIVFECAGEFIPKKRVGGRAKKRLLPWMNKQIKMLIRIRDNFFRQWLRNKNDFSRQTFLAARRAAQSALRKARDNWLWKLGSGREGSKDFWRYIHSKTKVPLNSVTFECDRRNVTEPQEVAARFSDVFKKNFSSSRNIFPFMRRATRDTNFTTKSLSEIVCIPSAIHNLLQQTKQNAAAGPDNVPAAILRHCAASLSISLSYIFNKSLEQGTLPVDWKTAAITPIPKDGPKDDMENYRPISITSLVGKTLERFIRDEMVKFLEDEKVIPNCQHGFRAKRSCVTLLTGTINDWTATLDEKSGDHIHAAFLDWSKAFDKVNHARLVSKLEHYRIKGRLLKWLENFLTGRTQFVQYRGARSEPTKVSSGVIQGSVLGPLLFNVFVSDLPDALNKCTLVQYADDATIYKKISCQEDADEFQEELNNVDIWCANNG